MAASASALTANFDVLAPTHIGKAGSDPLPKGASTVDVFVDAIKSAMDSAGFDRAHVAGYSLGGWVAMELARCGRALSVDEVSLDRLRRFFKTVSLGSRVGKHGVSLAARFPSARRFLLRDTVAHGTECLPTPWFASFMRSRHLKSRALSSRMRFQRLRPYDDPGVPLTIAWPQEDRLLPFERYGRAWQAAAPFAKWETMPGVGHVPNYDEPELVARQVLAATRPM